MSILIKKEVTSMKKLRTAIIDIGSNTIRLVLYEYDHHQGLYEFGNFKTVARLRTFLSPTGEMSESGIRVLADTLTSFKEILDNYAITDIKAVATAAIRQASNQKEIIDEMKEDLDSYNLPYNRDNYFVKKAEIMLENVLNKE